MKVAIVHYWLVHMRGGERVVEALCELYPQADLYTHAVDLDALSADLKKHDIRTTFVGRLPGAARHYQKYLPLMPLALEQLDLRDYDLVISSECGPAKGVVTTPDTLHVCYCHSPMRYVWDMYWDYLREVSPPLRPVARLLLHYLRRWDAASALRVDHFFANSEYVARRIRKHYRRDAEVVHPPVDTGSFELSAETDDHYLVVGQLVGYKRADLAVRAFTEMGKPLVVIGEGEQMKELKRLAGPTVQLLGRQPFSVVREKYARCRALVFPGEEDFGIVPVEAMAAGRPVIAFGRGGARETVVEGETGLFFQEQTVESLARAVERFESRPTPFEPERIRARAERFDRRVFKATMESRIGELLEEHREATGRAASTDF
ncbi:MAG: glycosyltransferase family 4 protein [Candidatus Palauibacterales bacterium]|nr:glycosyltransferase family 4 protein [Candidatus Palauibacterales bacterium]MDP2481789.1 glycosyltransferase family 4 protein [Candidatus Palauibacterales bacterium]